MSNFLQRADLHKPMRKVWKQAGARRSSGRSREIANRFFRHARVSKGVVHPVGVRPCTAIKARFLDEDEGMSLNALAHQPAVPPTIPPTSLLDDVSRHPPARHPQSVRPRARSRACVRTGAGADVATTMADVDLVAC